MTQPLHRREFLLLAQVIGLLTTARLIWVTSVSPRLTHESLGHVARAAFEHALVAAIGSVVISLALYLLISESSRLEALRRAVRTSSTAVWFAPATILLSTMSPAALGAALVLVVSATRLLYLEWRLLHPSETNPEPPPARDLFEPPPNPFRLQQLIPGLSASFGMQAGIIAITFGYPLLAAALFCLSVSMITLATLLAGVFGVEKQASLPRSALGLLLTVILAAGLTIGGVGFHFQNNLSDDDMPGDGHARKPVGVAESARQLLKKLMEKEDGDVAGTPVNVYLPPAGNVEITDDSFGGVILWPEPKPQPKIVAPSPSSPFSFLSPVPTKPLTIPFSGQYWMYKAPYTRPPKDSFFRRTTPVALSFVTTDHRKLTMEARQTLDHPIDLSCCRGIQIAIENIDKYPGTVSLEMVLFNTRLPDKPLSLGRSEVQSRPPGRFGQPRLPAFETIDFALPSVAPIHAFDEIQVIFHRDPMRVDHSARISIENFVLVPR